MCGAANAMSVSVPHGWRMALSVQWFFPGNKRPCWPRLAIGIDHGREGTGWPARADAEPKLQRSQNHGLDSARPPARAEAAPQFQRSQARGLDPAWSPSKSRSTKTSSAPASTGLKQVSTQYQCCKVKVELLVTVEESKPPFRDFAGC